MVETNENIDSMNMLANDPESQAFQVATTSKRIKFMEDQAKDPILNSASESEGGDDDGESEGASEASEEEEVDFEFPREDAQALL